MKRALTLFLLAFVISHAHAQNSITVNKKRPPQLDLSAYQKIAIGDIVGSSGYKTDRSMDLTDALTSQLFNSNTLEVIDRNALADILSSQRGTEIKAIDQTTTAALSKKINSAIMIIGRIQNEKLNKEQKSVKNLIVSNGCYTSYWWEITGDITVMIKIIDIKTGKMLFSNPVVQPIFVKTNSDCNALPLGDTEPLLKDAVTNLATEVSKIVISYDEKITIPFETPLITIFKNPFKKLSTVIGLFNTNNNALALEILKAYADDTKLKPELHEKAVYNYGVGLYADNQYDQAAIQIKTAASLGSLFSASMLQRIEDEKRYSSKLIAKAK